MKRLPLAPLIPVLVLTSCALAAADSQQVSEPGYPEPGAPAIVRLTSPGKTPRVPLRYAMPVGAKVAVDMTLTTEASMDVTGLQMKMPMLSLLAGVEVFVRDVSPEGEIALGIAFVSLELDRTNPRVDLAAAQQVEAALAGLTPFHGTIVITNRGIVTFDEMDPAAVAKRPGRNYLSDFVWLTEHITPVLPDEPVGVGAKWESRRGFKRDAMISFHRVEYEVTSIEGGVIKLKSSINHTAPRQQVTNSDLVATSPDLLLEKMSGKGSYTSTIVLNALAPNVRGTTTTTARVHAANRSLTISTTQFSGIKPAR